jgi:hypothetical protein
MVHTIIKVDLSFALENANSGLPIKLFHHNAYLSLRTPEIPLLNPVPWNSVCETLIYTV